MPARPCPAWKPSPVIRLRFAAVAVALTLVSQQSAAKVTLSGVSGAARANVEHGLALNDAPCDTPAWSLRRMTADARDDVRRALEPLGFYRAQVTIKDETPGADAQANSTSKNPPCWSIRIDVNPGQPTTYGNVELRVLGEGKDDPAFQRVIDNTEVRRGAVVHHGRYRALKTTLQNLAAQRGYFDAVFRASEVVVAADGQSASVKVDYDTGPRYRFGDVVNASDLLVPRLLDVLVDVAPNTPYNASALTSTHRNFLDSGYFSVVTVDADPATAVDLAIPVRITATPAKTRVYTGGIGFASDVGPRFRLNYRNRRINRRGHTLNSQLLASPVQSLLGVEYRIPAGDDRRDVFALTGAVEDQDTDTSEFTSFELGLRRTHASDNGWLRTIGIEARREDFEVGDQIDATTLLMPSIGWWRSTQSASPRPNRGYRLAFDIRGASDALGSDTSFLQLEANARAIHSLNERTRLLGRVRLGYTERENRDALPPSLRFFAGGDNSVRGYGFETIGPADNDGVVIGGSHIFATSLEIDYLFRPNWSVALFADTGSAFDGGSIELQTGVGIGLRRLTPVGPFRIDVAAPLDLDRSFRLHFSIGSDL